MYHKKGPMETYMREIGEIPLITTDEEIELARKIKAGQDEEYSTNMYRSKNRDSQRIITDGEAAREKLIKSNLRLVVKIAHEFKGCGLPMPDLISEGNIGLMRASEKFAPEKGAKFSSYSAWDIKCCMRNALSKSGTVRIPIGSAKKITEIRTSKRELTEKLRRPPTMEEISEDVKESVRVVKRLESVHTSYTRSLQDPIQKGEEGTFEDIIPDENSENPGKVLEERDLIIAMRGQFGELEQNQRIVLEMTYCLDNSPQKTLEEISKVIGKTREGVRQIRGKALRKLRVKLEQEAGDTRSEKQIEDDEVTRAYVNYQGDIYKIRKSITGFQHSVIYRIINRIKKKDSKNARKLEENSREFYPAKEYGAMCKERRFGDENRLFIRLYERYDGDISLIAKGLGKNTELVKKMTKRVEKEYGKITLIDSRKRRYQEENILYVELYEKHDGETDAVAREWGIPHNEVKRIGKRVEQNRLEAIAANKR